MLLKKENDISKIESQFSLFLSLIYEKPNYTFKSSIRINFLL